MTQFDVKPMPHKQIIFVVSILVLIEKKMLYKRQKQFMNAFQFSNKNHIKIIDT